SASPSKSATTVAIYCRSGRRSKNAAAILAKEGYKVIELAGGFNSWTSAGKPFVRGTSAE
ncbi:MAG: rhodanese-like domain-containing protein, partial [Candidatus Egerieousia sp.]|nr:rhodanese-like domain-containing protein [Candidatus Egerieousia sp.]